MKKIHTSASLQHAPAHDETHPGTDRVQTVFIIDMADDAEADAWDTEMRRRGF